MITTLAEALKETYGRGGVHKSPPYIPGRCVSGVWVGWSHKQCSRSNGHGPSGLYCKQHDPVAKAEKYEAERAAENARHDDRTRRMHKAEDIEDAKGACIDALKTVVCPHADGRPTHAGFDTCVTCDCPRAALKVLDKAINREV